MKRNYDRRGVIALIVKNNKVLMGKKCHRPGHFLSDAWHFPGGKADEGETPKEALIREMKEELNIEVTNIKRLCEYELKFGESVSFNYIFLCKSKDSPTANDDLVEVGYFSFEEMKELHHGESYDRLPTEVKEYLTKLQKK